MSLRSQGFWDDLLTRVRQLPGVEVAGMNTSPPMKDGFEVLVPFSVDGQPDHGPGRQPVLSQQIVSSDFFRTLKIPLLRGRDFAAQDRIDSRKVVIVDETLVNKYWPGQDPIGKTIKLQSSDTTYAVVGVVPHIQYLSPGQTESGVKSMSHIAKRFATTRFCFCEKREMPLRCCPSCEKRSHRLIPILRWARPARTTI